MKYPDVSKRFKYILHYRNMKQQELADKAGINKSFISHYVNGTHCPSNDTAQRLSEVLGVNPLWLMGLDDNMLKDAPIVRTEEEEKVVNIFNSLNYPHQLAALEYLKFLSSQIREPSDDLKED